ncbi:MAG TPA: 50S ribosomal protein L19 [Tissierellia bacterium]|jgi:large subunit ribosomal protein L19|nr:50S ribosomal protein L19 [Tissierellia bacterium]
MNESIIRDIESEYLKSDIPAFRVGDTVRVHQRITEGKSGRIQVFEGLVIKRQQGGVQERFTVRKLSYNVGVEKTFPLHSPLIEKIEVVRKGRVRRARLFYIRDRVGKSAKVKERMR